MRRGMALLVLVLGPGGAGCGRQERVLAEVCVGRPDAIVHALASAPDRVRLPGGLTLSDCVSASSNPADLQNVGATFTDAAARLAPVARRDPAVALRLGYLVGAAERGARRTAGFQAELVNRLVSFVSDDRLRGAERAAVERGRAAGRAAG